MNAQRLTRRIAAYDAGLETRFLRQALQTRRQVHVVSDTVNYSATTSNVPATMTPL